MDNDGDLDLVTRLGLGPLDDWPWHRRLVRRTSAGERRGCNTSSATAPKCVKDIVVVDFDRDGRLDVAMRMDSRTQIWLQETEQAGPRSCSTMDRMRAWRRRTRTWMAIGPRLEWLLVLPRRTRRRRVEVRPTGSSIRLTPPGSRTQAAGPPTVAKVAVADIDGGGTNDVAFSHSERPGYAVAWYRSSTPNGAGPWSKQPVTILDYCHTLQAADWDLDGDVDLLVGGMTKSQHRGLKLMLNNGTGMNWAEFIIQTNGSYSAEIGDIDNDGDLDIVGIRNWDAAPSYLYRSNAGGGPGS